MLRQVPARPATPPWLTHIEKSGVSFDEKEFVLSGYTRTEVYEMAAWLIDYFTSDDFNGETICLAADNKAIIASALLASLYGGPTLLLPFAFSGRALADMQDATGFTTAIADTKRELPLGTKLICPELGQSFQSKKGLEIDPNAELLKLFTGGSTGAPVSWSKTASNLFSEAFYLSQKYQISSQDLIVATVSPYHIYGLLFSILVPLLSSATVFADTPSFPSEITDAVQDNSATILASVPAHYRVLKGRKCSSGSLRVAFSSAGMLAQTDSEAFYQNNETPVVEVYGATETGGIATRVRAKGEEAFSPFDTVDWKCWNEELYVRSAYISPDVDRDGDGFFAANDRIKEGQNNTFYLLGRSDAVTKVGGKRVNLEEVRETIRLQPGVKDCIVLSLAEPGGRENRIAALVQGEGVNVQELRKNLMGQLEPYACPRLIQKRATFPLTAAGKYDMAAIEQLFA